MRFIDAPLYVREIIVIIFILTFVLSIIGLFTSTRLCKKRKFIIVSSILFALSFLSTFLIMRGSYLYRVGDVVFEPSFTILKLPLWLHCIVVTALLVCSVSSLIHSFLWNKQNLSPTSIKESADTLPAGICFYEQSGIVRLINTKMHQLCILTTGKALLDGVEFWQNISSGNVEGSTVIKKGEEPIIEYADGKVVSFKKYTHSVDEITFYEIVAVDITEQYYLTKQLQQKLDKLKKINKRLVEYGENVNELAHERELLATKIRIHDNMGKILLATKRKLAENLAESDKKELLNFWQAEILDLKNGNQQKKKNNLQVIEEAAELVGVHIELNGEVPIENTVNEKILITAVHECLTNTVSHANGKTMNVVIKAIEDDYVIEITNDGIPPKGKIIEGGGLSSLRLLVERENGKMMVYSQPNFKLVIVVPKGETL